MSRRRSAGAGSRSVGQTGRWRGWGGLVLLLLAAGPTLGQGFMVRPLVIDQVMQPGETRTLKLQVANTTPGLPFVVEVVPQLLTQGANGGWVTLDPQAPEATGYAGRTCLPWTTFSAASVQLAPMQLGTVDVTLAAPKNARGSYCGALLVRKQPPPGEGLRVAVQFLVPILINIQGAPAKERISADQVDLTFIPAATKTPMTSHLSMAVKNEGEVTMSVGASLTLLRQAGRGWRPVLTAVPRRVSLLPGVAINLLTDLQRTLPTGRYKVQGVLRVGGRVRGSVDREVDFVSDPSVTRLAVDVPLTVDPETLTAKAVPGSHRTALVTVVNPTEEAVTVDAAVSIPEALRGVAMGQVKGTDFTCAPWITIEPARFQLAGGGQRNLKLTMHVPADAQVPAFTYADLKVVCHYADGQSAGSSQGLVVMTNPLAKPAPAASPISLTLAQAEGDQYAVTARFGNTGNQMWLPKATASVSDRFGYSFARCQLETEATRVLPLGTPQFSGMLDFSKVEPGAYYVLVTMSYLDDAATARIPVQVEGPVGQRQVTVLGEAETPPAPAAGEPPAPPAGGQPPAP